MLTFLAVVSRAITVMACRGPRPLVICGPSGSGKSTLLKLLFAEYPETFGFCVSHTTRNPRPGETNGVHYYFVTKEEMKEAIDRGDFLESATFSGNLYGTSKRAVLDVQSKGKVCVLDIEIQGVEQIRKTDLNPIYVFINPPSLQELERRLRGRKTETEESLKKRLDTACKEIEYGAIKGNFDLVIYNKNLKEAYKTLRDYIVKELTLQKEQGINVNITRAE